MRFTTTFLTKLFLVVCLLGTTGLFAGDKSRQRIQELFIWKVSDHLGLSPELDTQFRKIIEDLNDKKLKASIAMKANIEALEKAKTEDNRKKILSEYEKNLNEYLGVQKTELEKLGEIFDEERMAKYLIVKAKLTENLRVLIGSGSSTKKKKLAKPKVKIED